MSDNGMRPICDDLRAETDDLLGILRGLSASDWDRPTPAQGWAVRDQVSHLAFFDDTGTLAATDAEAFAQSAKVLMSDPDPGVGGITKGRAMTSSELFDWFVSSRTKMIEVFEALDPKARLPWYGPAMAAVSFATARLMETWAHGQDIADTFGVSRVPTARLKHVAHIGTRARPFAYVTNGRPAPEGDVAVVLRAPNGETWTWNDHAIGVNEVRGDALDYCLVVTQRRHLADTNLVVSGPLAEDWMPIAQAFAGGPGGGREPGQFG